MPDSKVNDRAKANNATTTSQARDNAQASLAKTNSTSPAKPASPPFADTKAATPVAKPVEVAKADTLKTAAPAAVAPKPAAVKPLAKGAPAKPVAAVAKSQSARPAGAKTIEKTTNQVKEGAKIMITQNNDTMKKTADQARDTMDKTVDATREAGKNAADQVQATFGEMNDRAKSAMEKNSKIVQEMTDLTKGNVEALVASSRVAAKGVESLSREAAEFGRRSFEEASTTLKSMAEVRSPADLFRLQSDYVRGAFDAMVAESSKMSETVIKLAGEVAEPITNRYTVAAERVRTIAA